MLNIWMIIFLLIIKKISAVSYNQPKFCPNSTWNQDATTFADEFTIGVQPYSLFVNTNNTVYVAARGFDLVQVWFEGSMAPEIANFSSLFSPYSLFATITGDIYVDNGRKNNRIEKLASDATKSVTVMNVNHSCLGLFVDINNDLYCSMESYHQVIKTSLINDTNTTEIVAGNGSNGSLPNMLDYPRGIFVDINLDLYEADHKNHRIQRFASGQLNGITVASGDTLTFPLRFPTGIVLDADNYLFIVDNNNHRIIGSGPYGFRCLVGCSGKSTSASNELSYPNTLSFDSFGNMFVADTGNNRIQKFFLATNSCDETNVSGPTTYQMKTSIPEIFATEGILSSTSFNTIPEGSTMEMEDVSLSSTSFDPVPEGSTMEMEGVSLSPTPFDTVPEGSTMEVVTTEGVSSFTSSKMFIADENCSSAKITLISKPSIEYKLNEEIYISSNIQLHCKELFSIINQWTIYNCTLDCSVSIQLDKKIKTTTNELYIPPKMLTYGTYQFKLTVNIIASSNFTSSASINVKIIRSEKVIVNLIEYGTSLITLGQNQELLLEPGKYSVDDDGNKLIENEWEYEYYCRIYSFLIVKSFSEIDNSSCFSEKKTILEYNERKSLLKISANSFQSDRTYQFMVYVTKNQDKNIGYLLVHVQDLPSHKIAISCVISTMCVSDGEFQLINPTTQVALISHCLDNCSLNKTIKWNIYNGKMDFSTNLTQWTLFNQTILTFGNNTNQFTVTKELFEKNLDIKYWQFEVIYTFKKGVSSSSINFKINKAPSNGNCLINPQNGTTTTLFEISCLNWFDENEIKDYSFYVWTNDYSKRLMIGFTSLSIFQVRLPIRNSLLNLNVHIRDKLNCIKEYNISSIYIYDNSTEIENFVEILLSGNQNIIGQIITSISQEFNIINQNILKQINIYANIREYLINFTRNLPIAGLNSIILQSSSLVQLTQAINQLTRITSMVASEKCYELSVVLNEISKEISFEDVQIAATLLIQCTSNILNGINSPLQERTNVLELDLLRSNQVLDNNDLLEEMNENERNIYYQKEIANKITKQSNEIISLITLALNNHLNLDQNYIINTSEIFMSFETISANLLSDKKIQQFVNFPKNFPLNLNENQKILIRSKLDTLAPYGNFPSNTNFSRSLSLSIIDQNRTEIPIETNHLIELIIPRDPNLIPPKFISQNVTFYNQSFYYKFIDLKKLQINQNLTISIHFEIYPFNKNLSYLFIYQFDQITKLKDSIDGSTFFCPSNLTDENFYRYYIDNEQISKHESIIFGLRELTSLEFDEICLKNSTKNFSIRNKNSNFTSNYQLRIYTSGCYYLDQNNYWQSQGLLVSPRILLFKIKTKDFSFLVGPKTNLNQTQCFTNHL